MAEVQSPGAQARRWFAIVLGPLLFLLVEGLFHPELLLSAEAAASHPLASSAAVTHALAATLWIASWWFTEAVPIPVTSLLPLVLFPALGLGSAADVSRQYGHEIIFLFLGGLLLAAAMESTGLHERVALRIIRLFGHGQRSLVLGFMVATAMMSMWISNTATTVMLLPVALAVVGSTHSPGKSAVDEKFSVALLLGVAFGANIGGLGTPIGSPPNIVFQNIYRTKTGLEVSFGEWMMYGVPLICVLLPLTWMYLVKGLERSPGPAPDLPSFGPPSSGQKWVFSIFMVTACLWITRGNFGALPGWGPRLAEHGVFFKDSTVAIAAALVLFIVPGDQRRPILDWSVAPRLPWGVLILMGAGFAISSAFDASGLTLWIGGEIAIFGELQWNDSLLFLALLTVIVIVSILITEFASNTASANILLPIIFGVSAALGTDRFPPDLLMISCALACTTGFAMPAGTPPNALVFSTERISIRRFVRTGVAVDFLSLVLIVGMMMVWHLLA
ncbi:MAG: sodium-dependent dicarboxylate transporter 2/3/5 [Gammaproteobacteria bacterium]|jgi:sodium-dependent dicarboxylate transporter 2/3/5